MCGYHSCEKKVPAATPIVFSDENISTVSGKTDKFNFHFEH